MAQQTAALAGPLDILIGTPQKVVQHADQGHLFYGDVQFLVGAWRWNLTDAKP